MTLECRDITIYHDNMIFKCNDIIIYVCASLSWNIGKLLICCYAKFVQQARQNHWNKKNHLLSIYSKLILKRVKRS